ncbi:hypothetical protein DPSP01_006906 [Paraphaeosphaeria sporulosa]|uniref:RRM domain-containing protein n=1 Tax=Paraphaeosphaeria sporulosa TaxID=1460663 RepID=A0A177CMM6_9PLEO|nr:uncharacterized protein CC84DRAFT_1239722 [Paraphaeosphaeria sporulosa]OAG08511.1 hypothetical protein CC84DRAFT_1239722 [Paraphaeosphaeria sporulosa]
MAQNASFADFVKDAREKKRNEALAQHFLGSRGRKANGSGSGVASPNGRAISQKPTLLSRMSGVQKQRSSSAKPATNIDGKWQHDLHKLNNPNGPPRKGLNRTASTSQIERNTRTFDKFAPALNRDAFARNARDGDLGLNIRGAATSSGPHTVMASNFAIGTTAADIEQVMGQVGGELLECRVVVAKPTVMAELTFATKDGAENVIATFNGKKADGKTLYVYMKEGGPSSAALHSRPSGRLAQSSYDDIDVDTNGGAHAGSFQDGRYGFNDRGNPPRGPRRRY